MAGAALLPRTLHGAERGLSVSPGGRAGVPGAGAGKGPGARGRSGRRARAGEGARRDPCPARSFVLTEGHKRCFEKLVIYCDQYASLIPVSFVLGVCALEFPPFMPFMPFGDPMPASLGRPSDPAPHTPIAASSRQTWPLGHHLVTVPLENSMSPVGWPLGTSGAAPVSA